MSTADAEESPFAMVPPAPLHQPRNLSGYLQISLSTDGKIAIRGTRSLLEWLLRRLADDGWQIELDSVRWCG